jgi:UDP-3-O-[3-hydroxymyristoyl] glucosamine N-acyltransferase
MKGYTLGELAAHVGGRVIGNEGLEIRSAAGLAHAGEGDISFLANRKYSRLMKTTQASAVIVKDAVACNAALLVCPDPYYAFTRITVLIHGHRRHPFSGISESAHIASGAKIGEGTAVSHHVSIFDNAQIGKNCTIYPGVFIGPETVVGDDCILYPNVVIYDRCRIGHRVIIQANATVGEDGFGFATHKGAHHKIPHIGSVIIEDDVELGASSCIERGAMEDTIVGQGSKIGDSVVIGHGTKVGPYCLLVPQVGIAGSTTLGHHCVAAGQVGIGGHLTIGNGVIMGGQAGIGNDVKDGAVIWGSPAFEAAQAKRAYAYIRRLPEIWKELRQLKEKMAAMERQAGDIR